VRSLTLLLDPVDVQTARRYNSLKEFEVGLAVYCDVGAQAEAPKEPVACELHDPSTAAPLPSAEAERQQWQPHHAQQRPHDYLIAPMLTALHVAFNNNFKPTLQMQARMVCEEIQAALDPPQLQAVTSVVATMLHHQAGLQRELDKLAKNRFHKATPREQQIYVTLVQRVIRGDKLSSAHESLKDKLERSIVLEDLVLMRHAAAQQKHAEDVRREEEELNKHAAGDKSEHHKKEGTWESITSFFSGLVLGKHEDASDSESGAGSIQAALDSATPLSMDSQLEIVAEKVCFVLFDTARKSESAAMLTLLLMNMALLVDAKPGGELGFKAGVPRLTLADTQNPERSGAESYLRSNCEPWLSSLNFGVLPV
jgi:hypothetical protein